jgi:hypothetical protein
VRTLTDEQVPAIAAALGRVAHCVDHC